MGQGAFLHALGGVNLTDIADWPMLAGSSTSQSYSSGVERMVESIFSLDLSDALSEEDSIKAGPGPVNLQVDLPSRPETPCSWERRFEGATDAIAGICGARNLVVLPLPVKPALASAE